MTSRTSLMVEVIGQRSRSSGGKCNLGVLAWVFCPVIDISACKGLMCIHAQNFAYAQAKFHTCACAKSRNMRASTNRFCMREVQQHFSVFFFFTIIVWNLTPLPDSYSFLPIRQSLTSLPDNLNTVLKHLLESPGRYV